MSSRAPKTGLAAAMRAWMKARGDAPFSKRDVYLGIGITDSAARARCRNAVADFERRGEIVLLPPDRRRADAGRVNRYRYNASWQAAQKGTLKPRIFKAMYVSGSFAVTDIVRLTNLKRDWIDRAIKGLVGHGYVTMIGRRLCAHGAGAERVYHIPDRDRFRLEVLR